MTKGVAAEIRRKEAKKVPDPFLPKKKYKK